MDFWLVLGAVGSVASLVGLVLPLQTRHQRILHVAYGLAIATLAAVAVWYWQLNARVKSVERAANALVADAQSDYTHEGFVQAALAFLEKNKDLYPDSYSRAQKLVQECQCQFSTTSTTVVSLSFALKGLLKGIGTLEHAP
jgi:hypothetical protein